MFLLLGNPPTCVTCDKWSVKDILRMMYLKKYPCYAVGSGREQKHVSSVRHQIRAAHLDIKQILKRLSPKSWSTTMKSIQNKKQVQVKLYANKF